MSTTTVHLAGDMVIIGPYYIQRCLICGCVLSEGNITKIASCDVESVAICSYVVGGWYEVIENESCRIISLLSATNNPHFDSDLDIPDNCCARSKD